MLLRVSPTSAEIAFLLPPAVLFGAAGGLGYMLQDADTGWHIRSGDWILAHAQVPRHDLFSFTLPGQPWFAWEWLWDIMAACLHRYGGLAAVVLLSLATISFTFLLVYRLACRKSGNRAAATIPVTLLGVATSSIYWHARPALFTFLFLALFYTVLETAPSHRWLWLLPPLTVLWVNIHGGFFLGVLLTGIYAAGRLLRADWRRAALYTGVASACLAASLINPYGYHLHGHIWNYFHDSSLSGVREYQPTLSSLFIKTPQAAGFILMLALACAAAIADMRRKRWTGVLLTLGSAGLGLAAVRNVPVFVVIATPRIAALFAGGQKPQPAPPFRAVPATTLLVAVLVVAGCAQHWGRPFLADFPPGYPAGAANFLRPLSVQRVLSSFEWGSYLIYALRTDQKVFIDGRGDFYGAEFYRMHAGIGRLAPGWEMTLDRYKVDTVLVPIGTTLMDALRLNAGWQMIFADRQAAVFVRAPDAMRAELATSG